MRYLLDTHVWLWWTSGSARIDSKTRKLFDAESSDLLLSAASAWEIAIKFRIGRLPLPDVPERYVLTRIMQQSIEALHVTIAHAAATAELPLYHADPFDRLLVAQARCDGLTLVTADRAIHPYPVAQLHV